jgi:hypothetical protein
LLNISNLPRFLVQWFPQYCPWSTSLYSCTKLDESQSVTSQTRLLSPVLVPTPSPYLLNPDSIHPSLSLILPPTHQSWSTLTPSQGGSFLYVATVIQPLSSPKPEHNQAHHTDAESGEEDDPPLGKYQRVGLLMLGMVTPILLSLLVGDHGH